MVWDWLGDQIRRAIRCRVGITDSVVSAYGADGADCRDCTDCADSEDGANSADGAVSADCADCAAVCARLCPMGVLAQGQRTLQPQKA